MFTSRKPLVDFDTNNRASLAAAEADYTVSEDMVKATVRRRKRQRQGKGVRIVKGRVRVKVTGYNLLQNISPAHLIRHIPAARIRVAARQYLNQRDGGGGNKRRSKKKSGRRQTRSNTRKKEKQRRRNI